MIDESIEPGEIIYKKKSKKSKKNKNKNIKKDSKGKKKKKKKTKSISVQENKKTKINDVTFATIRKSSNEIDYGELDNDLLRKLNNRDEESSLIRERNMMNKSSFDQSFSNNNSFLAKPFLEDLSNPVIKPNKKEIFNLKAQTILEEEQHQISQNNQNENKNNNIHQNIIEEEQTNEIKIVQEVKDQIIPENNIVIKEHKKHMSPENVENKPKNQILLSESCDDLFQSDASNSKNSNVQSNINQMSFSNSGNDEELYYKPTMNEIMNNKYRVVGILGKGVYSSVLKVELNQKFYAVKILRNALELRESGKREIEILFSLNEKNLAEKHNILTVIDSFDHKGHLCIVLDLMGLNLRDMLNSQRKGKNFSLEEVRKHSWQMIRALKHLKNKRILHLDIKPDNILYEHTTKDCKLSDFGTSLEIEEVENGKEYVSRYYRAPEIFIGGDLSYGIDMWSMACTFYEMLTGDFLFPGSNDAHMIDLFILARGNISFKYLKKCSVNLINQKADQFFNMETGEFFMDLPETRKYKKNNSNSFIIKRDIQTLLKNRKGIEGKGII